MQVVIVRTAAEVAQFAADRVAAQLQRKPDSVLGLATGATPVATYELLIEQYRQGRLSFARCHTCNLDEYLGLGPEHPQSYRRFMQDKLFNHIDVLPEQTHLPDGLAADPEAECQHYENLIRQLGGVDLQLLGIGRNGHIGFNEPMSSLGSRTRIKTLTPDTVEANARYFRPDEFQPQLALTMGIGTIMEARQVLLLATGEAKAEAVATMVEGPVAARCPASALQFHPTVCVVLDEAAAADLTRKSFYQYVEAQARALVRDPAPW